MEGPTPNLGKETHRERPKKIFEVGAENVGYEKKKDGRKVST